MDKPMLDKLAEEAFKEIIKKIYNTFDNAMVAAKDQPSKDVAVNRAQLGVNQALEAHNLWKKKINV